jgi:DinB superfamily
MTKKITDDVTILLVRELEAFKRELDLFPDDESVWSALPGVTNSAANLALHVAGGLQHLVGAVLGGTTYVRDRPAEFGRRSGTRAEVRAELDRAIAIVREVLPQLPDGTLDAEFPETVLGAQFRTRIFLLHLCAHAAFHLGQAGYLRRAMTEDGQTSGALPLAEIGE